MLHELEIFCDLPTWYAWIINITISLQKFVKNKRDELKKELQLWDGYLEKVIILLIFSFLDCEISFSHYSFTMCQSTVS